MTHEYEDNMNRILEYLTKNDQELENVSIKVDSFQQDNLMVSMKPIRSNGTGLSSIDKVGR